MRFISNIFGSKKFTFIMSVTAVVVFSISVYVFIIVAQAPSINAEILSGSNTSVIYDKNGELITEIGLKKQEQVVFDELPDSLVYAIISIEDARFFEHNGIDQKRLIGATLNNISTLSYNQGASTINQQLIKNTLLTTEKKLDRKITEMYLSIKLDDMYTKEQILEMYLNNILFGGRIYGIKRASEYYFGKDVSKLNLNESATLAGMIQLPNYFNPISNKTETIERRNIVLDQMHKYGYITEDTLEQVSQEDIITSDSQTVNNGSDSTSFVDYVIYECITTYGIDPFRGNTIIYSSFDPDVQHEINNIYGEVNYSFYNNDIEAGTVVINNMTGEIEGISNNRSDGYGLSYATDVRFQPASTIKPILDYAPAIEYLGYSTATLINDDKTTYSDGTTLKNWDGKYLGNITLRKALSDSRNIPSLKLYNSVGPDRAKLFAEKLGLKYDENPLEAHSIGGFSTGFTVLEMTGAYSAFANSGIFTKPHSITKLLVNGEDLTIHHKSSVVMNESTAYMISDVLKDVLDSYPNNKYDINGLNLAGKTGQSNFDEKTLKQYNIPTGSVKDSWFIGYNTEKTIGTWSGHTSYDNYLNNKTKETPKEIFNILARKLKLSSADFKVPDNVIRMDVEVDSDGVFLISSLTPSYLKKSELFVIGTQPSKKRDSSFISEV